MPRQTHDDSPPARTRRTILEILKQEGPQDARSLAQRIGVTGMAVRQHLYELEQQRLVAFEEQTRPRGRPAKLWRLTPDADRYFPDRHADLAADLIAGLTEAFGTGGVQKLLAVRARQQRETYLQQIPRGASLRRKLKILADIRTAEGYMADVLAQSDGSFLLVENHCPICFAASACNGLCTVELDVFQDVLGAGVEISRTEHILAGARRCAYHVRHRKGNPTESRPAPGGPAGG